MKFSREEIEGIRDNFNQKGYYAMGNLTGKAVLEMALAAHDMAEVLEFYSKGGNFSQDVWEHPDLGYFTGKKAIKALKKWKKL